MSQAKRSFAPVRSDRQAIAERVYAYICSYVDDWGYSPARGEIAYDLGLSRHQVDLALVRLHGARRLVAHSTMPTNYLPPVA